MAIPLDTPAVRQFLRFAVVGVANTLTSYLVIVALTRGAAVPVGVAGLIGYAAAMLQSFVINRRWTFAIADSQGLARQIAGFVAVNALCAALFSAVVALVAGDFGLALATVIGVAATLPVNFALNRWVVFRGV